MSNRDDYNALLSAIQAISDDRIRTPTQPVDSFVQEAENLHQWAVADQEALEATGLDATFIEELPARAGALREAEFLWFTHRLSRSEAQQQWRVTEPEAYELRSDLLAAFRYAFRKAPELLGRVSDIAEGRSQADMIQDLNDIATLGRETPTRSTPSGSTRRSWMSPQPEPMNWPFSWPFETAPPTTRSRRPATRRSPT